MRHNLLLAFALLSPAALINTVAASTVSAAETTTQLPRTVRPNHYDVRITPDAKAMNFTAQVKIAIDVLKPTDSITLNAIDMVFSKVSLNNAAGKEIDATPKVTLNEEAQTASFQFGHSIAPGRYQLTLDYVGKIGTQAVGLFALDYNMEDGKKRALYTQFENSDARRMIPSWDEPGFRTTFALEAIVPAAQMAVSNMPISRQTVLADGRVKVQFATTPKMSTYLLFFSLGEFERTSTTLDGISLGVVTKKGAGSQADFALASSKAVLREYNDFFNIKYPLPKLDNIAAPGRSQFFGAMENWGAIFTFEYGMLLDPAIATQSDKQRVFTFAAHEIAHQWFGDLVTMRWWDDLWLNEGFASWMESRTTAKLHPEWNSALAAVAVREGAMGRDAVKTTHPIVQHIDTVEQANQAFDDITYAKGEAVIRMLENYVGPTAWRDGVRRYMKKHAYGNTVSDDLWLQIEAAAHKPVTAIAHDFTLQPGVPLIRVTSASCDKGSTTLKLEQGEFSKDQPQKKALQWRVPVIMQGVGARNTVSTLVSNGSATVTVAGCAPVIVNAGQAGYYRTLYTPAHFSAIATRFSSLPSIDQIGILSDSWSLGLAGLQSPTDFLDLASATSLAADPQIWGKISAVFGYIDAQYATDSPRRLAFRRYAISRLAPMLAQLGWRDREGELDTIGILRNELILALATLGDESVIGEARRRYALRNSDPAALPGPLRKTLLAVVAMHADRTTWDQIHADALAEKSALIKDQLYDLLGSTMDAALAREALALALSGEPGETVSAAMIAQVAHWHPDLAFDFAVANLAQVNAKVDASSRSRYFPGLAGGSADPAMIAKVNAYAQANLAPEARREADTAAANIAYRIQVRTERLPLIDAWLKTR